MFNVIFSFIAGLSVQSVCFIVLTQLYHGTAVIIVLTTALGFFGLSTSGNLLHCFVVLIQLYHGTAVITCVALAKAGLVVGPLCAPVCLSINLIVYQQYFGGALFV